MFEYSAALIKRLRKSDTSSDMMRYVGQTHHIAGAAFHRHEIPAFARMTEEGEKAS